jgi:hypothetical protein
MVPRLHNDELGHEESAFATSDEVGTLPIVGYG